jgi:hypothetical protein
MSTGGLLALRGRGNRNWTETAQNGARVCESAVGTIVRPWGAGLDARRLSCCLPFSEDLASAKSGSNDRKRANQGSICTNRLDAPDVARRSEAT